MGKKQIAIMHPVIDEFFGTAEEGNLCLTLEANGDEKIWVQVVAESVNMAYPFRDDPTARLERLQIKDRQLLELVQFESKLFATFGFRKEIASKNVARIVDSLFVSHLGCDDATYTVEMSVSSLNADDENEGGEGEGEGEERPTIHLGPALRWSQRRPGRRAKNHRRSRRARRKRYESGAGSNPQFFLKE